MDTWVVDRSKTYGESDADGWAYASTLERLIDSFKMNNTVGKKSSTSMVRRRRWIRTRSCLSSTIRDSIELRIQELLTIRGKIETSVRDKRLDLMKIKEFEQKRKIKCIEMYNVKKAKLLAIVSEYKNYKSKLEHIKKVKSRFCTL